MLDISTKVSGSSIRDLNRAIGRIQKQTGKSSILAVEWAARRVCRSARGFAKKGKPYRKTRNVAFTGARGRKPRAKKLQMEVWSQKSATPKWVTIGLATSGKGGATVADHLHKEKRAIKRAGLSKNVWKAMEGRVGRRRRSGGRGLGRVVSRNARVRNRLKPEAPFIALTNALTYQEAAFPGITDHAVRHGAQELIRQLDRNIERDVIAQTERLLATL